LPFEQVSFFKKDVDGGLGRETSALLCVFFEMYQAADVVLSENVDCQSAHDMIARCKALKGYIPRKLSFNETAGYLSK
jgi:hypothetical protein